MNVVRTTSPPPAFVELLDKTVFGSRGLTFRRTNWPDVVARWQRLGGVFVAAMEGERVLGTYALVPHKVTIAGQSVQTWYRAGLAVAPEARKTGIGAAMGAEVKRLFVDESPDPVVCYGTVERDNEPSQRVQLSVGYAPIAAITAVAVGNTLRPKVHAGVGRLGDAADVEQIAAKLADRWSDHVLGTDFLASLYPDETRVLREGGRVRAVATGRLTSLDLTSMPGVRGTLLTTLSPALRYGSALFATRPNRHLLLSNLWWDEPTSLATLIESMLAEHRVAHGIVLVDDRSTFGPMFKDELRGPIHRMVPSPPLDVWAGWKGLSDLAVRHLCDRPLCFLPGDSA